MEEKKLHKKTVCLASRPAMAFICCKCIAELVFTATTDAAKWVQIYGLFRPRDANETNTDKLFSDVLLKLSK